MSPVGVVVRRWLMRLCVRVPADVGRGVAGALGQFLGSSAGLSGPVITKLTETWTEVWRGEHKRRTDGRS